ncbi:MULTISPECIES: hypothetical protein [unclassified Burkholderia]|uniref:hypothetical protein n=1 Tax=unclassified Burkholderia TaxID=2613784 RepID=UPI0021AB20C8|nr:MULTISPECIES: hypothetical protein [unclassified Burkholderia]
MKQTDGGGIPAPILAPGISFELILKSPKLKSGGRGAVTEIGGRTFDCAALVVCFSKVPSGSAVEAIRKRRLFWCCRLLSPFMTFSDASVSCLSISHPVWLSFGN